MYKTGVHFVINVEDLLTFCLRAYGIDVVAGVYKVNSGLGSLKLKIDTYSGSFLLRVYPEHFSSQKSAILRKIGIDYLINNNISCPRIVTVGTTIQSEKFYSHKDESYVLANKHLVELYEWMSIRPFTDDAGALDFLVDVTSCLETFSISEKDSDNRTSIDILDFKKLDQRSSQICDLKYLREVNENLFVRYSHLNKKIHGLKNTLVHLDFTMQNIGVDSNSKKGVLLDLETMSSGKILEDVVWALADFTKINFALTKETQHKYLEFINKFSKFLCRSDLELIYPLILNRHLKSTYSLLNMAESGIAIPEERLEYHNKRIIYMDSHRELVESIILQDVL